MSEEAIAAEAVEEVIVDESVELDTDAIEETLEDLSEEKQEEVKEYLRKVVLKVDGEEIEEELPFDLPKEAEEYLIKQLQLAKVSNKRMEESSQMKKDEAQRNAELSEFMEMLKENPGLVMEKMGHNVKEFAEGILSEEVRKMEMSPEERKIAELKEQLETVEKEKSDAKKLQDKRESETLRDKYAAEFERDLIDSIDSSDLPNNPEVIKRLTGMMRTAINNKIDISFKDLVPMVKTQMNSDIKTIMAGMTAEQIIEFLGDKHITDIVSKKSPKKVAKKKAPPTANSIKETGKSSKYNEKKEQKPGAYKDFWKNIDKL